MATVVCDATSQQRGHKETVQNALTELFAAYGGDLSNEAWRRTAWNGLTTFAHAPPLRCFGEEAGVPYDVAVIGAPLDSATSFRPG